MGALASLADYSRYVAETVSHGGARRSTVSVWASSPYTGVAEGEVFFDQGIRLRLREELDFAGRLIAAYGYEVYRHDERLYWYDDFPHPNEPALAATFPHHKHIPPDIKRHRIPAPELGFHHPNLDFILKEIKDLL